MQHLSQSILHLPVCLKAICGQNTLYRNQWASVSVPYRTYGASVDMPVFSDNRNNYLAAGLHASKNVMGDANFADFYGSVSLAYHKFFSSANDSNNNHISDLAIGIQAGFSQNTIDITEYYFGQFIPYPYPLELKTVDFYPVNAGISFSHSAGQRLKYTIGIAGYNLNQPISEIEKQQNERLGIERRYIAETGADWVVTNKLTLRPAIFFQYRYYSQYSYNRTDIIAGNEFHYKLKVNSVSVFAGAWYHSDDDVMITSGVEFKGVRLGVGYDYNYSPVNSSTNGDGGFTLSFKFIFPSQQLFSHKRVIPCTRF